MVAAHYLSNRFNGFAWCANESDANELLAGSLVGSKLVNR